MNQIPFKPIYENENDAQNEDALAKFCERKWNVKMVRQRKLAQFDYFAVLGSEVKAFVEMRTRSNKFDQFPDIWMNINKLVTAKTVFEITKIPHLFMVEWSDAIGVCNLNNFLETDCEMAYMPESPNRRNAIEDREAIALIPINLFKILENK